MSNEQLPTEEGPKVELRATADGSPTLYRPDLDEYYHSRHGARQESAHVFIEAGLRPLLAAGLGQQQPLRLLEVGLGTGLNALLTLEAAHEAGAAVLYIGYETQPLTAETVEALAPQWASHQLLVRVFRQLHAEPWNRSFLPAADFLVQKINLPIQAATLPANCYDLIYFDAFAPEKQPELWTEAIFHTLYAAAAPGAVLVSYCAQGQFRRNLRAAGWRTERLPGPPGKREMMRASKPT